MRSKKRVHYLLCRRRIRNMRLVRTTLRMIGLLAVAGFALFSVMTAALGASGYLKPAVSARILKRAENYFLDGVDLYQRRRYRSALRKFAAAEAACPELFSAGYHVALVHRKMGDEGAAIAQLKKLNGRFPENIMAHNDLGVIYASKNEEASDRLALADFQAAIKNGEELLRGKEKKIPQVRVDLAMAYGNLGAMQLKSSDLADAEKSFRRAVEHYPRAFFGHFGLGNVLLATNKFGEAKAAYRKAREIEPDNRSVHIALAKCHLFSPNKNPRFAIAELKKVQGNIIPAEVFDLRGDAYALIGDSEEAIRNYNRYLTLPERTPQVLYKVGILYYNDGDREQAKKYLEQFVAEAGDSEEQTLPTAYKVLGDICREQKDYENAVANYLKGAKLRDAYFSCYYGLADSYFHLGQYEKAKEYLLRVEKQLPKDGSAEENELREKCTALLEKVDSQQ